MNVRRSLIFATVFAVASSVGIVVQTGVAVADFEHSSDRSVFVAQNEGQVKCNDLFLNEFAEATTNDLKNDTVVIGSPNPMDPTGSSVTITIEPTNVQGQNVFAFDWTATTAIDALVVQSTVGSAPATIFYYEMGGVSSDGEITDPDGSALKSAAFCYGNSNNATPSAASLLPSCDGPRMIDEFTGALTGYGGFLRNNDGIMANNSDGTVILGVTCPTCDDSPAEDCVAGRDGNGVLNCETSGTCPPTSLAVVAPDGGEITVGDDSQEWGCFCNLPSTENKTCFFDGRSPACENLGNINDAQGGEFIGQNPPCFWSGGKCYGSCC